MDSSRDQLLRHARLLGSTVPHLAAAHARVGTLEVRAMSCRGEAHVLLDEPRQDAFGLLTTSDNQWLACGVADGLGSYAYSAQGAESALRAGLGATLCQLDASSNAEDGDAATPDLDVASMVGEAARGAAWTADALGVPHAEVSTTLVLAVVPAQRGPDDTRRCLVVSAGDSSALVLGADGTWAYLTPEDDDRPGNVVASHLPRAPDGTVALCASLGPGDVLVLATDGFTIPLGSGRRGLGPGLAERWQPAPRELLPFIADMSFEGYHDDRAVIAMWC